MATSKAQLRAGSVALPEDHREALKACLNNISENWANFSIIASEVYRTEEFKSWGYESFQDFVQAELGLKYRSAMYRVQIGDTMIQHNLQPEDLGQIGWTKFERITPLLNKDMKRKDVQALLKKAKGMTVREIADFVETKSQDTKVVRTKTTMSFRFTNEQADVVNEALKKGMEMSATDNQSVGLEYVCLIFNMHLQEKVSQKAQAEAATKVHKEPPKAKKTTRKARADKGKATKKTTAKKAPAKKATGRRTTKGRGNK